MKGLEEAVTRYEGRYLRLQERGGWEYVARTNCTNIVGIVALTDDDEIVLVEQLRPPVQARCIELPAGLAGDIAGEEDEGLEVAAQRELLEETGYVAGDLRPLTEAVPSAGLCTERHQLFLARKLERRTEGGGDASEEIQVHVVPTAGLWGWLQGQRDQGKLISMSLYAGLWAAGIAR